MIDCTGICLHCPNPLELRSIPLKLHPSLRPSQHYISLQLGTLAPQTLVADNVRPGLYLARARPHILLNRGGSVSLLRRRNAGSDRHGVRDNVALSALLHLLAVHARCWSTIPRTGPDPLAVLEVYVFDVEGVDMAGEVARGV